MTERWEEPTAEEMAARKAQWEREAREPTPLPWRVVRGMQWDGKSEEVAIAGAPPNEDTVADNMEYYPHAIKAADAEFLVLRVNAHDALVAALVGARDHIRSCHGTDERPDSDSADIVRACDAALALARGGK